MHLDTAPAESVPAPLPRGRSAPRVARPGLSAEGRAALDEYDFERARGLFEEALEGGEGDAAAVALLELHVDSLAAWEDALAVEAKLAARQLTPPVRALLALAAAHVGDAASCRRLAHELLGPRLAMAFCVLAGQALQSGELLEAAQHLAEARERDGASAELIAVEKELARLKAAAREPAERALEALNAAGDLDGAVAAAEALLQRWPESGLARRVVRDAEARRDAGRVAALDARARHAFEAGEDEVALRLWGEAVELGAKGLEADVKRAAARLEARLKAERLSAVVERLREVSENSLRGYLELDDEERHSVRERVMDDALRWLELLQSSAQRSWVQDVAAVMALKGVLATSPPADVVVSLLRPFEAQVRKLEKGRAVLSWAAAQLEQAAQQERAAQLEEARGALARGELSAAIALAERHVEEAGQPGDEARAVVDEDVRVGAVGRAGRTAAAGGRPSARRASAASRGAGPSARRGATARGAGSSTGGATARGSASRRQQDEGDADEGSANQERSGGEVGGRPVRLAAPSVGLQPNARVGVVRTHRQGARRHDVEGAARPPQTGGLDAPERIVRPASWPAATAPTISAPR